MPSLPPPWPTTAPASGAVVLRPFRDADLPMVLDAATDPYIPLIGTLPAHATPAEGLAWIGRQRGRWAEGRGFSFAIALGGTDRAVGAAGLWLGGHPPGHASAGYSVAPRDRRRGFALDGLRALTAFAWSLGLQRVELEVEPANTASLRTAGRAGYAPAGTGRRDLGGTLRDVQVLAVVRPG